MVKTVSACVMKRGFTEQLPELMNMPYTTPANYELSQIRGHVRVSGAGGDEDQLIINAKPANGPAATGALRTLDITSSDFEFNEDVLRGIVGHSNDNQQLAIDPAAISEAVANAIKFQGRTEPGLLHSLI